MISVQRPNHYLGAVCSEFVCFSEKFQDILNTILLHLFTLCVCVMRDRAREHSPHVQYGTYIVHIIRGSDD